MLRFRGEITNNAMSLQILTSRRFMRRQSFFPSTPSRSFPLLVQPLPPHLSSTLPTTTAVLFNVPLTEAKRYFRAARKATPEEGQQQQQQASSAEQQQQQQANQSSSAKDGAAKDGKGEAGKEEGAKDEAPRPTGFKGWIEGLRRDMVEFPDIYNSANAINFILFTVFCLCSTGSNVEGDWWRNTFGVDSGFKPLAWIFHSAVMDNFLSMTFAMMLLHTMSHSVLPTIGSRGLLMYTSIVGVAAGVLMWAFQLGMKKGFGIETEKQFGPWDVVAGLMVMQYLHQGFAPWQILNSFNGWVRYACWVGAVCIVYYDAQPTALGAAIGFALCKKHPKFRVAGPAA